MMRQLRARYMTPPPNQTVKIALSVEETLGEKKVVDRGIFVALEIHHLSRLTYFVCVCVCVCVFSTGSAAPQPQSAPDACCSAPVAAAG
jgi:hypothetical protein